MNEEYYIIDYFAAIVHVFIVRTFGLTTNSPLSKLRVAFNNVHQRILMLPPRSRESVMRANKNYIGRFATLLRKSTFEFIARLEKAIIHN